MGRKRSSLMREHSYGVWTGYRESESVLMGKGGRKENRRVQMVIVETARIDGFRFRASREVEPVLPREGTVRVFATATHESFKSQPAKLH